MTESSRRALVAAHDFTPVRAALVRELKGDLAAAVVFTRIAWRCEIQADGWWRGSYELIAQETGLSKKQGRDAIAKLRKLGWLAVETRNEEEWDRTLSYQPIWDDTSTSAHVPSGAQACDQEGTGPVPQRAHPSTTKTDIKTTTFMSDVADAPPDQPSTEIEPIRQDVERLCEHLAEQLVTNGCKPPVITKAWRDAARRMLDLDGRSEQQVRNMIDWCQADEFWRGNILSMPKLRQKYDQMRLQAMRPPPTRNGRPLNSSILQGALQRMCPPDGRTPDDTRTDDQDHGNGYGALSAAEVRGVHPGRVASGVVGPGLF